MSEQYNKVQLCYRCLENNQDDIRKIMVFAFQNYNLRKTDICGNCGSHNIIEMNMTKSEYAVINKVHPQNPQFLINSDQLKQKSPEEFHKLLIECENQISTEELRDITLSATKPYESTPKQNTPTCPTCGSTNVKKISGGKRWVTTGLFGLGSSNIGKSYECCSCKYKW